MRHDEYWQNFGLGVELHISGTFIYNGLKSFHEMRAIHHPHEVFEVFYNVAVGLERIMKICIVLIEHDSQTDQKALEESLITHDHLGLLDRVIKGSDLKVSSHQKEFVHILTKFYKTYRYDRFSISSIYALEKEKEDLQKYLAKHLGEEIPTDDFSTMMNSKKIKKFFEKSLLTLSRELYRIVNNEASKKNIYTYELMCDSKAMYIFLGKDDMFFENDIVWKELIVYLMNTENSCGMINHIRAIKPLDLDPGLIADHLLAIPLELHRGQVRDEMTEFYSEMSKNEIKERLQQIEIIGEENIHFPEDEEEE